MDLTDSIIMALRDSCSIMDADPEDLSISTMSEEGRDSRVTSLDRALSLGTVGTVGTVNMPMAMQMNHTNTALGMSDVNTVFNQQIREYDHENILAAGTSTLTSEPAPPVYINPSSIGNAMYNLPNTDMNTKEQGQFIQGLPTVIESSFNSKTNHGSKSSNSSNNSSNNNSNGNNNGTNRGKYKCGRCGQPKANHVCPYGETVNVMSREVETLRPCEWWAAYNENLHPWVTENTLDVKPRDINASKGINVKFQIGDDEYSHTGRTDTEIDKIVDGTLNNLLCLPVNFIPGEVDEMT